MKPETIKPQSVSSTRQNHCIGLYIDSTLFFVFVVVSYIPIVGCAEPYNAFLNLFYSNPSKREEGLLWESQSTYVISFILK